MNNENFEVQRDFWFACVDIDVLEDNRLTPIEKVVFCLLCRYVNLGSRDCFPSIKKLAEKANCSEFSVQKALKRLAELGLIERQERFINGRQTTSLYTIIGFKAPYYKNKSEAKGGSTKLTPPPSTLTHEGQSDVPPINDIQNNDIIYSTREADLPNSTGPEKTNEFEPQADPKETSSSDNEKNQKNVDKAVNSNPEEKFTPDNAPEIMKATAELLLLKTGRKFLAWEEVLALRELSASQMPARVQKEIDTACERFMRQGKSLSSLRFEYIASALRNQPTRGKKAKNKSQSENVKPSEIRKCTDAQAEAEMARIEELQAKFDGKVQADGR